MYTYIYIYTLVDHAHVASDTCMILKINVRNFFLKKICLVNICDYTPLLLLLLLLLLLFLENNDIHSRNLLSFQRSKIILSICLKMQVKTEEKNHFLLQPL